MVGAYESTVDPLGDSKPSGVPPEVLGDPDPVGSSVRRLGRALVAAAYWVEQEMLGENGSMGHPLRHRTAHRLIARLDDLVMRLEKLPAIPDPNARFIPPCPVCGEKAGQHWAHECEKLDRFGREVVYDYQRNERIFREQIRPFAEPLKPNPRDLFTCIVCRSRWEGASAEKLLAEGHAFGESDRVEIFKFFKERGL